MDIKYTKKDHEITYSGNGKNTDKLVSGMVFIAVIGDKWQDDESCTREAFKARDLNTPMFAVIKDGIKLKPEIESLPWIKKYQWVKDMELEDILGDIKKQLRL